MLSAVRTRLASSNDLARKLVVDTPALETDRLWLRAWTESDAGDYRAMLADPEVTRYLGGGPVFRGKRLVAELLARLTDLEARRELVRMAESWRSRGAGMWAIERKHDGVLLGAAGFNHLSDWREGPTQIEIGWTLARSAWGSGYATEAGRRALRWGFEELGLDDVISVAPVEHVRSIQVMERLGLVAQGKTRWHRLNVVWYAIDRAGWARRG